MTAPITGDVSAFMLYELGIRYVILGHSERFLLDSVEVNTKKDGMRTASRFKSDFVCEGKLKSVIATRKEWIF